MKIKLFNKNCVPERQHAWDAGLDLKATKTVTILPGETYNMGLGVGIGVPCGEVALVVPRSSIGTKTPLRMSNSIGVIDAGYTGEIHACYTNMSDEPYTIHEGDRIAQLVTFNIHLPDVEIVDDLGTSARGANGFGSTGGYNED